MVFVAYWEFKKKTKEARVTFLENKAREIEKESNLNCTTILQQMITREKQQEASRRNRTSLQNNKKWHHKSASLKFKRQHKSNHE